MKLNKPTRVAMAIAALTAGVSAPQAMAEDGMHVGGAVRVQYQNVQWNDASKDKGGDLDFELAALRFDGKQGDWGVSVDYWFKKDSNYLRYGYAYYDLNPEWQLQFGVTKVPFGNPGYLSHSYWLSAGYYLGFEDDYDAGAKAVYTHSNWQTDIAFFKNGEYSATENKQYTAQLYTGKMWDGTEYHNEETNQINLRQVYNYKQGDLSIKAGGSVEVGQIYNSKTEKNGDRYAVALHMDGNYQGWNLRLQAMQYEFDAENPEGMDDRKIGLAALGWQWEAAAKAQIYSVNLAKTIPTSFGSITLYNDFDVVTPDESSFDDSMQNIIGMSLSAGHIFLWADYIQGKNMLFSTKNTGGIALPEVSSGWDQRININIGYYF